MSESEVKDLRPTFEGADALMSLPKVPGQVVRAAWILWRNDKLKWVDGGFYDDRYDEPIWYGRAWLKGAIRNQLNVSDRQASRILKGLLDEKLIVEREAGHFFFVPPDTYRTQDTKRPTSGRKTSSAKTQSVPAQDTKRPDLGHKTSSTKTQSVPAQDTKRPDSGHKASTYTTYHPPPNTTPLNPCSSNTREESREERERRYAEAQRRQAEEHRRREGERFGLPAGFLEKYYVKGDGR